MIAVSLSDKRGGVHLLSLSLSLSLSLTLCTGPPVAMASDQDAGPDVTATVPVSAAVEDSDPSLHSLTGEALNRNEQDQSSMAAARSGLVEQLTKVLQRQHEILCRYVCVCDPPRTFL